MSIHALACAGALALVPFGGHAATFTDTLNGFEAKTPAAGEPLRLGSTPFDFNAGFVNDDMAGVLRFDFENEGTLPQRTVVDITVNQNDDEFFTGGAEISWGGSTESVAEGALRSFQLSERVQPGGLISLTFDYGDPVGSLGGQGQVGPDFDAIVNATPVPVPASLPLLLGALGGFGWLARRRRSVAA